MAATKSLLNTSCIGSSGNIWLGEEVTEVIEEESMETTKARLRAMTWAAQAKDITLRDLQTRLQEALEEVEQSRCRQAALQRRAEVAEAAEEALASQMAELEAEAYASITDGSQMQAALEQASGWERRCRELEAEMAKGRAREAALLERLATAEAAEEALASQMAELEAEAYGSITQRLRRVESKAEAAEAEGSGQVAELIRRLAEAERALKAAEAKLQRQGEWQSSEKRAVVRREGGEGEQMPLLMSLQELAGIVKLRLWSPSSLAVSCS